MIDDVPGTSIDPEKKYGSNDASIMVAIGLRRLKDENVFFILLSLFQLVLGLDAIVRQNVIQLMAHTSIQIVAVAFAAIQVGSTIRKHLDVEEHIPPPENPDVKWNFNLALRNEIGLVSVMTILALVFIHLCYKLYKQFGWNIYKRIGADIKQQARFRLAQVYLLILKLDAFFHFVLCVFYTVIMTQEKYYTLLGSVNRKFAGYVIHIILTILLIPGLLLARFGVIKENKQVMMAFLVTQCIMALDFILILVDSAGSWVFWNLAVCLAIGLCIATFILSIMVQRNFGKGLRPYMQRLFVDESEKQQQAANDGTLLKKQDWLIDEDEEETYPEAAHVKTHPI
ncbi:hypothetical protein BD560DRAFT_405521 [Blakeslea trispora]|nr:hypothetical protein BD560DRAFT_405521 [Blakeslea trispora]